MKTIFIIASGIADIPETETGGETPLMLAETPSLDALARCGCCGSMCAIGDRAPLTRENAILSLLGYDFRRGAPSVGALERFGKIPPTDPIIWSASGKDEDMRSPGFFIIPKFSGHGVAITSHPAIRGIARMALLRPLDVAGPEGESSSALKMKADAAVKAIEKNEFVLLHVECAASMSRKGDLEGKINAIESIDHDIISTIADYVWNAKEQMNMVVTCEGIVSWKQQRYLRGEVPAVVYFNDDLPYDTKQFDEESVIDGPLNTPLPGDLIRKLVSFEPFIEDVSDPLIN